MEARRQGAPLTSLRLGVSVDGDGAWVSVYSRIASEVSVAVFDGDGYERQHVLSDRFGDIHYGWVPGMAAGDQYGLRVDGPWDPDRGMRCNPARLLIDPYAQAVVGEVDWTTPVHGATRPGGREIDARDNGESAMRSLVVDHTFDWGDERPLRHPWSDTIIYETHVKSLTMLHPDVPPDLRGTYAGMATPPVIDHLNRLGVSAVELLPVQQFVHDEALWRRGLRNLWGYQPIAWCAPHNSYAADPAPGAAVGELKHLIKALHGAGIEVILDVVYNHTAEIDHTGPSLSFRGIDNHAYYRLDHDDPSRYRNDSGIGNTVNAESPVVHDLIVDSLRGWVQNYHVDGFRFDLATTLGRRGLDVRFDHHAPLLRAITEDPVLAGCKLIAEPWDVGGGGYKLGHFPSGWGEWNDTYRQTVRDFWRGAPGEVDALATRLMGSHDVFGGRPAATSINYVTAHDGFTLHDLVSYNERHNRDNGEDNRDGSHDNRSWNGGHEGPTDDSTITTNRDRRRRSFLATLLLSNGIPMIAGGDELGRTQRGNNNAYAQDSEISWYDWTDADDAFLDFVRRVIRLRRELSWFGARWFAGDRPESGGAEAVWYGPSGSIMSSQEWEADDHHTVALSLHPVEGWRRRGDARLIVVNGGLTDATHIIPEVPHLDPAAQWQVELDTSSEATGATWTSGDELPIPAHSLLVLRQGGEGTS